MIFYALLVRFITVVMYDKNIRIGIGNQHTDPGITKDPVLQRIQGQGIIVRIILIDKSVMMGLTAGRQGYQKENATAQTNFQDGYFHDVL
jgi:hypothetical protein